MKFLLILFPVVAASPPLLSIFQKGEEHSREEEREKHAGLPFFFFSNIKAVSFLLDSCDSLCSSP